MFTRSPATMPWSTAPRVATASPVITPARARSGMPSEVPRRLDPVDDLQGGADRALRVVLVRDRRAPHRHDRVADELLDDAAVPLHRVGRGVEVAPSIARTSSASRASENVVKPTRSTNRTDTSRRSVPPAPRARRSARPAGSPSRPARRRAVDPHSPQNLSSAALAVPQVGQASASRWPHSLQNLRPGSFVRVAAGADQRPPPPGWTRVALSPAPGASCMKGTFCACGRTFLPFMTRARRAAGASTGRPCRSAEWTLKERYQPTRASKRSPGVHPRRPSAVSDR